MMRRILFLLIWVVAMVFPLGWFLSELPVEYQLFNKVFKYEWAHIVGHLVIFTVLGVFLSQLLAALFAKRSLVYRMSLLVLIALTVAGLQEAFQILFMDRTFGSAELFDLGTDLVGALVGACSERLLAHYDGSHRDHLTSFTPPTVNFGTESE